MLLWGLGAVGFVCVALVLGQAARYRHERTIKDWNKLLSPGMRFAVQSLELEVQADAAIADGGLHGARPAPGRGGPRGTSALGGLRARPRGLEDARPGAPGDVQGPGPIARDGRLASGASRHWYRSATIGCTRVALSAGRYPATRAVASS